MEFQASENQPADAKPIDKTKKNWVGVGNSETFTIGAVGEYRYIQAREIFCSGYEITSMIVKGTYEDDVVVDCREGIVKTEETCDGYNLMKTDYYSRLTADEKSCEDAPFESVLVKANSIDCGYVEVPMCTAQYDPVCGTDGVTYGSGCALSNAGVDFDYDGECVEEKVNTTCTDSDGGLNYSVKGKASLSNSWVSDYCYDFDTHTNYYSGETVGDILYEGYCENNSLKYKEYSCPDACVNAVCLQLFNETKNETVVETESACDLLIRREGFLFENISDYTLVGFVEANQSESNFPNVSGTKTFAYMYAPDTNDSLLVASFTIVKDFNVSQLDKFKNFINLTLWDSGNYGGSRYYDFHLSEESNKSSYFLYDNNNFLVVISLYSNKSFTDDSVATEAIQKYISACPSNIEAECKSDWAFEYQPLVCPSSGVHKEIWTDIGGCQETIEKEVSCVSGDCAGCNFEGECYPVSYRIDDMYCDFGGIMVIGCRHLERGLLLRMVVMLLVQVVREIIILGVIF